MTHRAGYGPVAANTVRRHRRAANVAGVRADPRRVRDRSTELQSGAGGDVGAVPQVQVSGAEHPIEGRQMTAEPK